ncbi:MAG: peptide chain release factor N(5)-glutamine methyltransferase [Oscillospiraceae bacterium]|nr:peptide chain release factor N(5)-glutamine methyltransferase [Oscillospiraceae bacterium]
MKTYNDLYLQARNALRDKGVEAYTLEARLLVATAAGKTTQELLRDLPLYTSSEMADKVAALVERRVAGEPVAYITGSWEFYGLPMVVTTDVLIPRMDTELLIDAAKELLSGRKMDARVLDLCCGSGCIACAVGHELPAARVVAVDLSAKALEVARKNIAANRLSSRVICMQADATANPPMSMGQFDMVLCNPPYIKSADMRKLDPSVRDYEPSWALDGGKDGLKFYKAIVKYWKAVIRPGGYLLFEVGEDQAESVKELLLTGGFRSVSSKFDTLGVERVVIGKM